MSDIEVAFEEGAIESGRVLADLHSGTEECDADATSGRRVFPRSRACASFIPEIALARSASLFDQHHVCNYQSIPPQLCVLQLDVE